MNSLKNILVLSCILLSSCSLDYKNPEEPTFLFDKEYHQLIKDGCVQGPIKDLSYKDYDLESISESLFSFYNPYESIHFLPDYFSNSSLKIFTYGYRLRILSNKYPDDNFRQNNPDIDTISTLYYRHELYLEATYFEQDSFNEEVLRISNLKSLNGDKQIINSENLFPLPSFVIQYNYYSSFRYILYDIKTLKIIYISFFAIGSQENLVFKNEYIPTKKLSESDINKDYIEDNAIDIFDLSFDSYIL